MKEIISPKQKANELVHQYVINIPLPFHIEDAKICALIAVDEIWNALESARAFEEYNFWSEVRQEIKKL